MSIGRKPKQRQIQHAIVKPVLLASTILGVCTASVHAQSQDPNVLEEIVVLGSSYETEDSKSYASDLVSVGEKEVVSVREVPQSTHVITRQKLEDGGYTSLDTALRETPGTLVLSNDDGRSSLFSRGFEYDSLYFSGLPAPLSSIYGTQPDMAIIDHVEILRGPAGLFGGSGEPTGAINMRLKQAQDVLAGSASITAGSYDNLRGDVDVTGPLNKSGTVRGRFVGALQHQNSWIEGVDNGVGVAYGTIQTDLSDDTMLTLSISHMQRDITPFNGLPTYADGRLINAGISTTTIADWNRFENSVTDYIAELNHNFEEGGHAKLSARYSVRDVDFLYGYTASAAAANGDVNGMRYLARKFEEKSLAVDAHVSKPFEAFGRKHNAILGADYRQVINDMQQAFGVIPGTFNLFNWNSNVAEPTLNFSRNESRDPKQFGIYSQVRVNPIDRLTLIGGGRLSWYNSSTTNNLTGAVTNKIDINHHVTPYAGATFDVTESATIYGSYTSIFQPQEKTDVNGKVIDPREGFQYEVGVKSSFFDERFHASGSFFWLEDTNRAIGDPNNPGSSLARGKVRSRGVDLELSGTLLENLEVAAGYTYTETENLDTGAVFSTYTPEHMLHLWAKYTFDDRFKALDGLYVGAGMRAFSEFYAKSGNTTINAPGYAVFDAFAGYDINEHLSASVNVDNLFNKQYYERVGATSVFNFQGKPRTVSFKLTSKF